MTAGICLDFPAVDESPPCRDPAGEGALFLADWPPALGLNGAVPDHEHCLPRRLLRAFPLGWLLASL
ncbi:MAG: hypothetical protein NTX27_05135, partial [Verrucomicrobia bacterium]|nr:hypothetical protein [Verrucomicrobiota bacterium]